MSLFLRTFPCTRIRVNFLNFTSDNPSLPNANVPRYPILIVPAAPSIPVKSEANALLGEVGVVTEVVEFLPWILGWGL